jgi:hypothetical protein
MNKKDKRLYKKPKYKIGDIVVYQDRYTGDDTMLQVRQSKVVQSDALIETAEQYGDDELTWTYNTEESLESSSDYLDEDDILYKL